MHYCYSVSFVLSLFLKSQKEIPIKVPMAKTLVFLGTYLYDPIFFLLVPICVGRLPNLVT